MLVIHQDEMFPADIVVLGSSIESGNDLITMKRCLLYRNF
jgi:hypothetical protein